MRRRLPMIFIFGAVLLVLGITLVNTPAQKVNAQCSTPSECKNCHEAQGQKSVAALGAWHTDHAPYDFCESCHGGARLETNQDSAHVEITKDLNEMAGSCKSCHPDDFETRYKSYAVGLGLPEKPDMSKARKSTSGLNINPSSPLLGINPLQAVPVVVQKNVSVKASSAPPQQNSTANWILAGVLLILAVAAGGFVLYREPFWRERVIGFIRQENWSPYAAGVLLGITGILSVVLGRHLLSASGGFATVTSTAINGLLPELADKTMYFKFIMPPGLSWEVVTIIGIVLGGALGALTSRTFKIRWNEDSTWNKILGPQRWKRFLLAFLGAAIVQFGAGIAGGCTSGLAISGGMTLAPSGFLFMGGMFASGIVTALIIYRRRY
jgi:uncharacterized protein